MVRILTVGDVCGSCGVDTALKFIPKIKREEKIDFTIVNGENSALGNGITPSSADLLFAAGADVITGGNHTLRHREVHSLLDENPFLLRPHNLDAKYGSGYCLVDMGRYSAAVINLSGQIYLENLKASNPFLAADELVERAKSDGARFIFVDIHAEATSEKRALGFYLDGKITALFGTHTHVQTADAQILPYGTGYITDLGMTGAMQSVLGVEKSIIINRLRDGNPEKFRFTEGAGMLCGCIFEADNSTGLVKSVKSVLIKEDEK